MTTSDRWNGEYGHPPIRGKHAVIILILFTVSVICSVVLIEMKTVQRERILHERAQVVAKFCGGPEKVAEVNGHFTAALCTDGRKYDDQQERLLKEFNDALQNSPE